jgi:DNA repair exonuclease SbcCD ATPase subunit
MEGQLKAVYHTYPIIMEEEKPHNVKKYISELSGRIDELAKRPTAEDLVQAVEKEKEAINNYTKVKGELDKWLSAFPGKSLKEVQIQYSEPKGSIISEEEQKKLNTYESLKAEKNQLIEQAERLKRELVQPQKDSSELITAEIKKLFTKELSAIKTEIAQLKQVYQSSEQSTDSFAKIEQPPAKLPADYEEVKRINKDLYAILAGVKENLPKDK